ncbi:MAG: hypothetical protein LRY51_06855 [Geovibrio sp.]|nr:hypothetical protein [Geovibrio sp.]
MSNRLQIIQDKETENADIINKFINRFICGDAVETMRQLPDESIDLIITSPPYNLKKLDRQRYEGRQGRQMEQRTAYQRIR